MALLSHRYKLATHESQAVPSGSWMGGWGHWRVRSPASTPLSAWATTLAAHLSGRSPGPQKERYLRCTGCPVALNAALLAHMTNNLGGTRIHTSRYLTSPMAVLITRAENHTVFLSQQAFGYFTRTSPLLYKRTVILHLGPYHVNSETSKNHDWTLGKTSPSVLFCSSAASKFILLF